MATNAVTEMDNTMEELWTEASTQIAEINPATENWKAQTLPLARIKKIMKIDEGILQDMERERQVQDGSNGDSSKNTRFMIAGEAPVLLGKACELMIREMTARAWRHTERNRRRTLQRQDVHAAVGESEVYDFLIDFVPRVTNSQAPPPPGYTEPQQQQQQHIPQLPQPTPMPMAAPPQPTEMGISDAERYSLQMHQMHDPQVPPGYEQYYMQMHQARMQAEAAAAPPPPMPPVGTTYMAPPDAAMPQWGTMPPQQQQQQQQQHPGVPNNGGQAGPV